MSSVASVDSQNTSFLTWLRAIFDQQEEVVLAKLEENPHWAQVKLDKGIAAALMQERNGHREALLQWCEGATVLHLASLLGLSQVVQRLASAEHCAVRSTTGATALMCAAQTGQVACMKLLLAHSEVKAVDHLRNSALILAAKSSKAQAVSLLLPLSDVSATDISGQSALMWAVSMQDEHCVRLILPYADLRQRHPTDLSVWEHARDVALYSSGPSRWVVTDLLAAKTSIKAAQKALEVVPFMEARKQFPHSYARVERAKMTQVLQPESDEAFLDGAAGRTQEGSRTGEGASGPAPTALPNKDGFRSKRRL